MDEKRLAEIEARIKPAKFSASDSLRGLAFDAEDLIEECFELQTFYAIASRKRDELEQEMRRLQAENKEYGKAIDEFVAYIMSDSNRNPPIIGLDLPPKS